VDEHGNAQTNGGKIEAHITAESIPHDSCRLLLCGKCDSSETSGSSKESRANNLRNGNLSASML
jgi:hypothetical protein